LVIETCSRGS